MGTQTKKPAKNKTNVRRWVTRLDDYQRQHKILSIPIAVIKKYHDDEGGYQAALITYYGFLSLFPLLLVATSVIETVARRNEELRQHLFNAITNYFPTVTFSENFANNIHATTKTGFALFVGLVIAIYGARGIANVARHTIHIVWAVPRYQRVNGIVTTLRSLAIIVTAGAGLILAAALSGYATNSNYPFPIKLILGTCGFVALVAVFWGLFSFGSSAPKKGRANVPGALIVAVALLILQGFGTYLIASQLTRLTSMYVQYGVVLVLFFWIYLQAQVFLYAIEYNTVREHRLYPRSLDDTNSTEADKRAHALYAARDNYTPEER